MTVKFAISLVIRPAEVGRPRSCAPVAVSVTAHLVRKGANWRKVASELVHIRRIPV